MPECFFFNCLRLSLILYRDALLKAHLHRQEDCAEIREQKGGEIDVNEAVDISKKAVGAMNVNQIDLTRRLDSLEMETITKIDHYPCHDKSTIPVKLEKVGLFAPDLVRITAFRDFLSSVIDKSLDVIHDAIITSTCVLPPGWLQYMLIGLHFLFLHHFFHHFVRPPHVFSLQHSSRPYLQQKEEDLTVSYGL